VHLKFARDAQRKSFSCWLTKSWLTDFLPRGEASFSWPSILDSIDAITLRLASPMKCNETMSRSDVGCKLNSNSSRFHNAYFHIWCFYSRGFNSQTIAELSVSSFSRTLILNPSQSQQHGYPHTATMRGCDETVRRNITFARVFVTLESTWDDARVTDTLQTSASLTNTCWITNTRNNIMGRILHWHSSSVTAVDLIHRLLFLLVCKCRIYWRWVSWSI